MTSTIHIGFLLFHYVTQLDMTGPVQILSRVPGARTHLVWKKCEPVVTDAGFSINPTVAFSECPQLDVLCVPGGFGVPDMMHDGEVIAFLRQQAEGARYVTSVCNGALLLGAAGLLKGYRSACHWMWRDYLRCFGAEPADERVVRDRNRISGGGVTAGIDFGLTLAAELAGDETAKLLQLAFEYDPKPPFDCGTPEKAGSARVAQLRALQGERIAKAEEKIFSVAM